MFGVTTVGLLHSFHADVIRLTITPSLTATLLTKNETAEKASVVLEAFASCLDHRY